MKETKICTTCKKEMSITNFYVYKRSNKLYSECKDCCYIRTKEWQINNREKCCEMAKVHKQKLRDNMTDKEWSEFHRKTNLKSKFGMTLQKYEDMFKKQNGVCAICGNKETSTRLGKIKELSIDHNHYTGSIRGLLCAKCNLALGLFDENINIIKNAIKYLEYYTEVKQDDST